MAEIRTLHLVYTLPNPPFNGYDLRHLNLMKHLADRIDQTVLCRITEPLSEAQKSFCDQLPYDIRTVLIPHPTAAQKLFKGLRFLFKRVPVLAGGWYYRPMAQAIESILAEQSFDLIVLEGIWNAVYWPTLKKSRALKVLNLYDLEAGLLRRQADVLRPGLKRILYANGARRMARLEKNLPRSADLIWTVSENERQVLLQQTPDLPVFLAPGGVDREAIRPLPPQNGKEILFVGSFQYFPNTDGVQYFVEQVMPDILKHCPDAIFRMAGRRPGARVTSLHRPPSVILTGQVDDLTPCYRKACVCVVPLRSGGGTRLKILEAMAYGRPVVSTTIGAEGIDVEHNRNILIADRPAEMAEAVRRVLNDSTLAQRLAKEGRRLVESRYAWNSIADTMYAKYKTLTNTRGAPGSDEQLTEKDRRL